MNRKVTVVGGAGNVGATVARAIAVKELADVVVIDIADQKASGIALVVAARRGLPIAMHTPSEVKAAVSGSGRADKAQVGAMVVRILRLSELPKPADAADALALAITHVWRGSAQSRIDAAVAQAGPRRTSYVRTR